MAARLSFAVIMIVSLFRMAAAAQSDSAAREAYLRQLMAWLPREQSGGGTVSPLDKTWTDWQKRTGELPPDFNAMPSLPFLPDPLVLDEGGANTPVKTAEQWQQKRRWIAGEVQHWLTGTLPPGPNNLEARILSETKDGRTTLRMVELRFGPQSRAKMTAELIIPPGAGPFPVFMTQWNHRGWALVAVRRGYIGCVYAGADDKDDTEEYADIWYPQYDFTRLARRAWGASRVIDYLYTLSTVDKDKIAITGHSRNGKQSLIAAAFDERITAVITSSAGTGGEVPWRYTSEPFDNETIIQITTPNPNWFHPRLRFFVGREHKLPAEQNLLMALIAPRGLLISSARTEHLASPWALEQCYGSLQRVYRFVGAEDKLAVRFRGGRHGTSARDIEDYVDFCDYCFGRSARAPENRLYYDYDFEKWRQLAGEKMDVNSFAVKTADDLLKKADGGRIETAADWVEKKNRIQQDIRRLLGDEPAGATNPGPGVSAGIPAIDNEYSGDYLARVIGRPRTGGNIKRLVIGQYRGFGDYLEANLYYPADIKDAKGKLPVIIWLHEYSYPTGFGRRSEPLIEGFTDAGFAVLLFDQIGFGTRIEEGSRFYERYPHWSKMGKMVADTIAAVDMLRNLDMADANRIYAGGWSLGGTVAILATALDERIGGVLSISGVTPWRQCSPDTEGLRTYSHLHGLMPRLGFFLGSESRIPCDFAEILACIAPRPALIVAPQYDRFAPPQVVAACVEQATAAYEMAGKAENMALLQTADYAIFSEEIRKKSVDWANQHLR